MLPPPPPSIHPFSPSGFSCRTVGICVCVRVWIHIPPPSPNPNANPAHSSIHNTTNPNPNRSICITSAKGHLTVTLITMASPVQCPENHTPLLHTSFIPITGLFPSAQHSYSPNVSRGDYPPPAGQRDHPLHRRKVVYLRS